MTYVVLQFISKSLETEVNWSKDVLGLKTENGDIHLGLVLSHCSLILMFNIGSCQKMIRHYLKIPKLKTLLTYNVSVFGVALEICGLRLVFGLGNLN